MNIFLKLSFLKVFQNFLHSSYRHIYESGKVNKNLDHSFRSYFFPISCSIGTGTVRIYRVTGLISGLLKKEQNSEVEEDEENFEEAARAVNTVITYTR